MTSDRSAGANFVASTPQTGTLKVSAAGSGSGSITGPGINCPGDCSETYANGANVTLSASAGNGSSFGGWSGDCSGGGASCQVAINGDASASAAFDPSDGVTPFYSSSSPFNTPVPANPTVAPNSSQIVQRLASLGPPAANNAGAAGTPMDWSHPVYFAKASDPVYTIHQTGWANPDVEGRQIHIPVGAKPAGGDDASFSVVDTDGWEYDFWQAQAPSGDGGTFTANFAKRAPWDGNGLGTSGTPYQGGITAAGFSNQAGVIRLSEMKAGVINHALFMSVRGWNGRVWPSAKLSGTTGEVADPNAPAMGQHFWLDMTQPQIDALSVPEWQKIILRAMAKYGMYVGDNGGSPWALQFESGDNYTSFGQQDPWIAYAQAQGITGVVQLIDRPRRLLLQLQERCRLGQQAEGAGTRAVEASRRRDLTRDLLAAFVPRAAFRRAPTTPTDPRPADARRLRRLDQGTSARRRAFDRDAPRPENEGGR